MRYLLAAWVMLALVLPSSAQQLRRVTESRPGMLEYPAVDQDGDTVVAWWQGDPGGVNSDRSWALYRWSPPSTTPVLLLEGQAANFLNFGPRHRHSLTDDGSTLAIVSNENFLGTNADGSDEIYLISAVDGTVNSQVTNLPATAGPIEHYAISGDGTRLVFGAPYDPVGANPGLADQVFTVFSTGAGVRAVTSNTVGSVGGVAISDDGGRVALIHDGISGSVLQPNVYKVFVTGGGLTAVSPTTDDALWVDISGNGETISWQNERIDPQVFATDWALTNEVSIGTGTRPSLPDDGLTVYYSRKTSEIDYDIVGQPISLASPNDITGTSGPIHSRKPAVSGDGNQIVFETEFGSWGSIDNDDGAAELVSMSTAGLGQVRLTENGLGGTLRDPEISADGSRIAFQSLRGSPGLWVVEPDGFGLRRLTQGFESYWRSFTPDGETLAFVENKDLLDINGCAPANEDGDHLFTIGVDGSALSQISPIAPFGNCPNSLYSIDAHATGVVHDFNPNGGVVPFFVGVQETQFDGTETEVYDDGFLGSDSHYPSVDAAGVWVAFHVDIDGSFNPERRQVWRVRTDGTGAEQLTFDPTYQVDRAPDISDDGTRIAFASSYDPLGTNPDHNVEIFVLDFPGPVVTQVTDTTGGANLDVRLSGNGEWIWFQSDVDRFGVGNLDQVLRVEVATGRLERAQGLVDSVFCQGGLAEARPCYSVSASGDQGAIVVREELDGRPNPGGRSQVYLVEFGRSGSIDVSASSPTLVSWNVDPRFSSYDVIRGDVASLQFGAVAGTVDLGSVVCLEEDSSDVTTSGFEDPVEPASGQAFFYLRRGRAGPAVASEAWGFATDGSERQAASGDCAD